MTSNKTEIYVHTAQFQDTIVSKMKDLIYNPQTKLKQNKQQNVEQKKKPDTQIN